MGEQGIVIDRGDRTVAAKGAVALAVDGALPERAVLSVAQLHVAEIPGGFLSRFGERFLRLVYEAIVTHQESFLIGALVDRELVGFICGSTNTTSLYRSFAKKSGVKAALALFPSALSFNALRGIAETVFYPVRPAPGLPNAAILNFAVAPKARGQGVGSRLLHALGVEFRQRGEGVIRIVCGADQVAAQRLYLRYGATQVCTMELHRGVESKVLVWDASLAREDLGGHFRV